MGTPVGSDDLIGVEKGRNEKIEVALKNAGIEITLIFKFAKRFRLPAEIRAKPKS